MTDSLRTLAFLFAVCAAGAASGAQPAVTDWSAIARRDIEFAGASMASKHAGVAAGDMSVTVPLETGLRIGLAEAEHVRSQQDYRRLMMRFIAGFGDPHTNADVGQSLRGWTGLVLDLVDGRYRVVLAEPGWPTALPPVGAIVDSCDGVWFGSYLKNQVAPFVTDSVEYPSAFSTLAQKSMLDWGLGWAPQACAFTLPDGSRRTYSMAVQGLADAPAVAHVRTALRVARPVATAVRLTPLGPGKSWVGMPSFDGAREGAAYEALYPTLAALPKSGWVVFDLRGNGGGNSAWGRRALAALFGDAFAAQLARAGGAEKYLVADDNSVALLKHYIAAPEFASSRDNTEADLVKVEAAMRAGEKLALVSGEPGAAARPVVRLARPHGPRIAAVIDRNCFSSCMNFLQQIRAIDDSVVLGEATIGYSPFGEISAVALPSGQGKLYIPTALFKTAQAARAPFVPDLPYAGNMADDAALQRWVGTRLDKLGRSRPSALKTSSGAGKPRR